MFCWLYKPPLMIHYTDQRYNYSSKNQRLNNQHPPTSNKLKNQLAIMGTELPLVRSQSFGSQNRGRGGNRGWHNWNYGDESQVVKSGPIQQNSQMIAYNYSYVPVPNLTSKKNVWNNNNSKSRNNTPTSSISSRNERGTVNKGHMNPSGDSICASESLKPKTYDMGLHGFPVIMNYTDKVVAGSSKTYKKGHISCDNIAEDSSPSKKSTSSQRPSTKSNTHGGSPTKGASVASSASTTLVVARHGGKRRTPMLRQSSAPPVPHRAIRGRYYGNTEVVPYVDRLANLALPDRYLSRYARDESPRSPGRLFNGGVWDKLSESIWDQYSKNYQNNTTFRNKLLLWKYLWTFVKAMYPTYGLFLVGSTMSGFGFNHSDIDLCLLVRQSFMDQRSEAVMHLEQLLQLLMECNIVLDPKMIQAKVPILRFRDMQGDFEVDLNCNNAVGIRNTHLQYCYSQLDWRVKPLVLIIKQWAQKHRINDAKNMTISSYSLVLMVIHFLQCGVVPPVLPCLHTLYHGKFVADSDVDKIDLNEQLGTSFMSDNRQALGELLHDFLDYYVNFNYDEYAISVRTASRIPIEECRQAQSFKNDPHQWTYLCVEEPFDLTNTAQSVYDPDVFATVKNVFEKSLDNLKSSHLIESIFLPVDAEL